MLQNARVVLLDLLREHGRPFATVTTGYSLIPRTNAVEVKFTVKEGPKAKS